jgi:hypothetical protein
MALNEESANVSNLQWNRAKFICEMNIINNPRYGSSFAAFSFSGNTCFTLSPLWEMRFTSLNACFTSGLSFQHSHFVLIGPSIHPSSMPIRQ